MDQIVSPKTTGYEEPIMKPIILDTCVLVAIFMVSEENHRNAKKLADYLIDENIQPRIPMHGFFELACVFKRKETEGPFELQNETNQRPFNMKHINIDHKFFEDYYDPSLPYIKSGDFIFLAMATSQ